MTTGGGEIEDQGRDRRRRSVRIGPQGRSSGPEWSVPPLTAARINDLGTTSGAEKLAETRIQETMQEKRPATVVGQRHLGNIGADGDATQLRQ